MKFFNEMEDAFLQKLPEDIFDMDSEIFSIGREIKKRLGDDGYLLDNYLGMILEAINSNTIQNAWEDSEEVFSIVYRIFNHINEGTDIYNESICKMAIYPEVKKYHEIYTSKYRSLYTAVAMTCIAVTPVVMKKAYRDGNVEYNVRGRLETVRLRELYDQIITHAGANLMDRLSELVKVRFLISPALNAYMQAATNHYLDALLQRDDVSSKQLFQLILNSDPVEPNTESEDNEKCE